MKNILLTVTVIFLIISVVSNAQDITNTLAPNGSFKIKDSTTDYFILNQENGTIRLVSPLAGNIRGSIFKGGSRFLHTYHSSGTEGFNTFIGLDAGNFTMGGSLFGMGSYNTGVGFQSLSSLTTGYYNSAFGINSLFSNTTGTYNSAFGTYSLYSNTTGNSNSAFGSSSLAFNTTGYENSAFGIASLYSNTAGNFNSAFGRNSLFSNTTGINNSSFGTQSLLYNTIGYSNSSFGRSSLYYNTAGYENSAFGYRSLFSNTTGIANSSFGTEALYSNTSDYNSAFGYRALYANTSGYSNSAFGWNSLRNSNGIGNTAVGTESLFSKTTGDQNTSIGYFSGYNITTGSTNITIGYNAQVPNNAGNNQIRLGNAFISYAGIQVGWTITSDRRWKNNIQPTNLGLGFISKLNPVSYTRKNDESKKLEYGLIAQEIEEVLNEYGVADKTVMLTVTDEGMYELRYNDLIAPMIKAIQELSIQNEKLSQGLDSEKIEKDEEIAVLKNKNQNLEERLAKFEEMQTVLVKKIEQIESSEQMLKVQIVNSEYNNQ